MRNAASLPRPLPSKFVIFDDFSGGMNTQSARQGLPEKQAAWLENLQPIAPNKLQAVPAPLANFVRLTGETIVSLFYFDLGSTRDYVIAFCLSGAGYAIANPQAVVVQFAPPGTFSTRGPDVTNYLTQRLLIADSQAGYCTWDGTVFVKYGGMSPNFAITAGGSLYANGATVTRTGGSGSGDTYSVQVVGGVVVGITLLTPGTGFLSTDVITLTINAVSGGSGATANGHVWPSVTPSPTTVAVAFGRVWLASTRTLIVTGTGSSTYGATYDDFQTADASVTTVVGDTDLAHAITVLRYIDGYLYIIGDNSVKFVGGITVTSGVTNFTVTPLSSDQGTVYPLTVISYNRLVLFANQVGVFAILGASVQKISDAMDGIFAKADFSLPLVSAAVDLRGIRTYLLLLRYNDPAKGSRTLILGYANQRWFVMNQGTTISAMVPAVLGPQFAADGETVTYAASADGVFQTLAGGAAVEYELQTSLTPHGDVIKDKRIIRAGVGQTIAAPSDLDILIESENSTADVGLQEGEPPVLTFVNDQNQVLTFVNNSGQPITFVTTGFVLSHGAGSNVTGRFIGATVTGTLANEIINGVYLEYQDGAMWGRG